MPEPIRGRAHAFLFVLLCGAGLFWSLAGIVGAGNELSNVDRYSEANALREVRNFLEHGLTRHAGLGNVVYPGLYPNDGFAREPEVARLSVTEEGVYTHYPPGPEYLLYAAAKLLGPEPVWRLRLLPVALGCAALFFLGLSVRARFGDAAAWLTMGTLALTPAVSDGFAGLHYQGYATALTMVEIGLTLRAGCPAASLAPFALLGFAQGWLSFDYAFLVALVPLSLELCLPCIDAAHRPDWRTAWARAILAGAGFAAAHGLHFLQVAAYWGSFEAASRDFGGAAAHRAAAGVPEAALDRVFFSLGNLKLYLYGLHPLNTGLSLPEAETPENWSMFRFLGLALGPWWVAITLAAMLRDAIRPGPDARKFRMDWYRASLTSILTSSVWILAMANHAGHHRHFLYRHLFFAFFVAVLFGAVRLARQWERARAAGHRGLAFSFLGGYR